MELFIKSIIQSPSDVQNLLSIGTHYGLRVNKIHTAGNTKVRSPHKHDSLQTNQDGSITRSEIMIDGSKTNSMSRSDHVIHLGRINLDQLSNDNIYDDDVPRGYENNLGDNYLPSINSNSGIHAVRKLKIHYECLLLSFVECLNNTKQSILTLHHHQFLPENSDQNDINLSIYEDDHYQDRLTSLQLGTDESQRLYMKLTINQQYSGQFKRLLLLHINIKDQSNILVSKQTTISFGVMIVGVVISNQVDKSLMINSKAFRVEESLTSKTSLLSIDAKVFKPIPSLKLFDQQCQVISAQTTMSTGGMFRVPLYFLQLSADINIAHRVMRIEQLATNINYIECIRCNMLEHLMKVLEFNNISDLIEKHLHSYMTPLFNLESLQTQLKLIDVEEIHRKFDIAHYDLHNVTMNIQQIDYIGSDRLSTSRQIGFFIISTLKVPGSNESRPHISIGDIISLRPVDGDLIPDSYLYEWQTNINIDKLYSKFFEIQGIITNFSLTKEEITIEIPWLNFQSFPWNQVFSQLRYNIRFSSNRSVFWFIERSLRAVMADSYYMDCFYPNQVTISNLHVCFHQYHVKKYDGVDRYNAPKWTNVHDTNEYHVSTLTAVVLLNEEQTSAVKTIELLLESNYRLLPMPPYIIYGPPGTGKTKTVIEAMRRLIGNNERIRILACAPSDAAADVMCRRLAKFMQPHQLLRLNWWQRSIASLPAQLLPYSYCISDVFDIPNIELLISYQVIVCNCGTAGIFQSIQEFPRFDAVFVDEASQAIEAEVLVPLVLTKKGGMMVLAGDPNQLGSSIHSPLYELCLENISLQERLLRLPCYESCLPRVNNSHYEDDHHLLKEEERDHSNEINDMDDSYNRSNNMKYSRINLKALQKLKSDKSSVLINPQNNVKLSFGTFLYKNYRSHGKILDIPSRLFYSGALRQCVDISLFNSYYQWDRLATSSTERGGGDAAAAFPMLFVGVDGKHKHELESPSFHNDAEINEVVSICLELVQQTKVSPSDIGVIAAFRQQVLKIRLQLRQQGQGLSNVNVGSVEDFQGQEVKIVVISTVLSEWVDNFETKGAIGLIGDPKRFNVAITRGMALCVIVGQPFLLMSDPYWKQLLNYCYAHGAYQGMKCDVLNIINEDDDTELLNSIIDIAHDMLLDRDPERRSKATYHYDREWRNLI